MFVFNIVVGGLLFSFGGLIAITSIEPASWNWDDIKRAFRVMLGRMRLWVGIICVFIGFLMLFVPMLTAYNW